MTKGKKKVSIDFGTSEYETLKNYTKKEDISSSQAVNNVIWVYGMSPDVRKDIVNFCKKKSDELKIEESKEIGYCRSDASSKSAQYLYMANLLNFGIGMATEDPLDKSFTKIYIKGGYVIFPKNWIVLPDVLAPTKACSYAYAVECRDPYGKYNMPHFIAFGEVPSSELTQEMEDQIYQACSEKYEPFKDLWNAWKQVESSFSDPSKLSDKELQQWDQAPVIGIFPIVTKGDPAYWTAWEPDYKPPYGAMIIRDEKN